MAGEAARGSRRCFTIGHWTVDSAAGELHDGSRTVRLRPKAMVLLTALADRPGEVFTKEKILDEVWPEVVVGDASVSVLVAELRDALGDDPDRPIYIETIPRRGYRLIAAVTTGDEEGPRPESAPPRIWLIGDDHEFALVQGEHVLGRGPEADVRINSTRVSRKHARIVVDGERVTVEDLGSKNGTFVGDVQVNGSSPLAHGDELRIGHLAAILRVVMADDDSTMTELSRESPPSQPSGLRSKN